MKHTTKRAAPKRCECKQCGHEWYTSLVGRLPLICPKIGCRSWYWNCDPQHMPEKRRTATTK
jgi:hypothetical protein